VTILEATVRLIHNPSCRALLVAAYPTIYDAGDHVSDFLRTDPLGLEGMDDLLVDFLNRSHLREEAVKELLKEAGGWLLVEYGGDTQEEANEKARLAMQEIRRHPHPPRMDVYQDAEAQADLWEIRESGLAATAWVPGEDDTWPGWEDSAVPPDRVGDYLRDLRALFSKFGFKASVYGHFGDGCIHCRINFPLRTEEGVRKYRAFIDEAADLVLSYGGSLSGEHGDGQARGALLGKMYGPELLGAFRDFKRIWDPAWRMNPGKVVDADPPTADLRLGPEVHLPEVRTHFRFPNDGGSFAHAAQRCVGVGKCRKTDGGTMCPSYMVVGEEKHTTRGRAHLLFEMLVGDPVSRGWGDEAVKESLDLCLSCKGCKSECPVDVDIATYRSEFMSHYYEEHRRPLAAYAFGHIDRWARLAALAPDVANLTTQLPLVGAAVKRLLRIAPERRIPAFAPRTFRDWWDSRGERARRAGTRVILWPDTFNNHFHPATAAAAVEVLEDAGCAVVVPRAGLCCGRPLYEFGFLDRAKRLLLEILDELRDEIRAGVPIVGLEPSCTAVFRDELRELFPDDPDACRLSEQVFTLDEFLNGLEGYEPPLLDRRAIVHGHCHQKSIIGMDAHQALLRRMGVDAELLDSGCCGMAGAFGFEKEKYDVSIAAGERVLLPAVRGAAEDELIIASGFSCREQIEQQTDRRALHVAEVLRMAVRERGQLERLELDRHRRGTSMLVGAGGVLGAGVLLAGVLSLIRRRR
jgi:Fe-S oxidoreductase